MNLKNFLLVAALSASVGVASAAPGDPIALLPAGPGSYSASFTQFVDEGGGLDTFTFSPDSFAGLVSVSLTSVTGPVTFSVAQINDQIFGVPLGADPYAFSFQAYVTSDMPLTLTVLRVVEDEQGDFVGTGSYNVALTAAVPEPQTWALMLGGLFALGVAGQRRGTWRKATRNI